MNTTLSSCYVAMKHIFPEVPVNGGAFRPATFNGEPIDVYYTVTVNFRMR